MPSTRIEPKEKSVNRTLMLLACTAIVWPVPAAGPGPSWDPCPVAGRQPRGEREMSRQAARIAHAAPETDRHSLAAPRRPASLLPDCVVPGQPACRARQRLVARHAGALSDRPSLLADRDRLHLELG